MILFNSKSFLIFIFVSYVYGSGSQIRGTNINKPPCLLKWEKCMASDSRPTTAECDQFLFDKYKCAKPKPANKDRMGDYDYVIIREQEDKQHQEDINAYKDNRKVQAKAVATVDDDVTYARANLESLNNNNMRRNRPRRPVYDDTNTDNTDNTDNNNGDSGN